MPHASDVEQAEMKVFAEELRALWVEKEDALAELLEESGLEYEYGRHYERDTARTSE